MQASTLDDATEKGGSDTNKQDIDADQGRHYDLPSISYGKSPYLKDLVESLSQQLSTLKKELQLRNNQLDQLMHLHIKHKEMIKNAADAAGLDPSELDQAPLILQDLNKSFRHDIVRTIVSINSIKATYIFPNSHYLTLYFQT
jgi:hypothetical protein